MPAFFVFCLLLGCAAAARPYASLDDEAGLESTGSYTYGSAIHVSFHTNATFLTTPKEAQLFFTVSFNTGKAGGHGHGHGKGHGGGGASYWAISLNSAGSSHMSSMDVVLGTSAGSLTDRYATGLSLPGLDTAQGCENSYHLMSTSNVGSTLTQTFWRYADTGDRCDSVITPGTKLNVAWAVGSVKNGSPKKHSQAAYIPRAVEYWGKVPDNGCLVGAWGSWGPCSKSCGGGEQSRTRRITRSGFNCPTTIGTRVCDTQAC